MDHTPSCSSALPAEELLARTVYCHNCNAPNQMPCQKIQWVDGRIPRCVARPFHSRRLKDAEKVQVIRQRKTKGETSNVSR